MSAYNQRIEKAFNKIQNEVSSGARTTGSATTQREKILKATGYQGMKTPLGRRTVKDVLPAKGKRPADIDKARKSTLRALQDQYNPKRVGDLPEHVQKAIGAGKDISGKAITAQTDFTQLGTRKKDAAYGASQIKDIKDAAVKKEIRNLSTVKANEMISQLETTAKGAGKIGSEGRLIAGGAKVDIEAEAVKQKAEAMKVAPRDFKTYESAEQAENKTKSRKARLRSRERALKAYNKDVQADIDMKSAIEGSDEETYKSTRSTQEKAIRLEEQRVKDLQKDLKNKSLNDQLRAAKQKELTSRKAIIAENKGQLKAQKASFNKQFGKGMHAPGLQNLAFTAPFALSMGAGFIPEGKGGTAAGIGGGALQGAAMGGAMGSMALMAGVTPWTLAIAGTVAALAGLDGAMKKWKPTVEELSAVYKSQLAETTANTNAATQYVKVQEQLNAALSSGDVKRQEELMGDISQALNEIVDSSLRDSLITAGSDIDKLNTVIRDLGSSARQQAKELAFFEEFRAQADEQQGFSQRWLFQPKKGIGGKTSERLEKQLATRLNLGKDRTAEEGLSKVAEMRGQLTDEDSTKRALVDIGGLDEDMVNDLFQDAGDFGDVLRIISGALDIEAEQIRSSAFFSVLTRQTSVMKSYETALTRVANGLSTEFDRIVTYFEQVSSLSKTVFSERLQLAQSAGIISPQTAQSRQIEFNTEGIRAQQAVQTVQLIKTFLKDVKNDDDFKPTELEGAYEKSMGSFAETGNAESLIRDVVLISQRVQDGTFLTAEKIEKIGTRQLDLERETIDQIRDLNAKSSVQIAALNLNNRLAERGAILGGAAQAGEMASEDVFSLKRLGAVLQAQGAPSITSQDQIARLITDASGFMKARNIEGTPEFKEMAMNAQQSQILTNAARTLTAVPGLDFIREQDPNFGFGDRDKMMEFFNLEDLKKAPTAGPDLVENRERFFEDTMRGGAEKEFLNERLLSTPQYQDFTGTMGAPELKTVEGITAQQLDDRTRASRTVARAGGHSALTRGIEEKEGKKPLELGDEDIGYIGSTQDARYLNLRPPRPIFYLNPQQERHQYSLYPHLLILKAFCLLSLQSPE